MYVLDADIKLSDKYFSAILHVVTERSQFEYYLNEDDISVLFWSYLDWLVTEGMEEPLGVPSFVRIDIQNFGYIFPLEVVDEIHRELSSLISKYAVSEGQSEGDGRADGIVPFSSSIN